ncbi:hypothetical protein HanPSC8_Chr03g0088141 [Helianthus annuus]|nr:hypothetical protein HanPSC8_Chr03g0088141 [Helianthus annuus]
MALNTILSFKSIDLYIVFNSNLIKRAFRDATIEKKLEKLKISMIEEDLDELAQKVRAFNLLIKTLKAIENYLRLFT